MKRYHFITLNEHTLFAHKFLEQFGEMGVFLIHFIRVFRSIVGALGARTHCTPWILLQIVAPFHQIYYLCTRFEIVSTLTIWKSKGTLSAYTDNAPLYRERFRPYAAASELAVSAGVSATGSAASNSNLVLRAANDA